MGGRTSENRVGSCAETATGASELRTADGSCHRPTRLCTSAALHARCVLYYWRPSYCSTLFRPFFFFLVLGFLFRFLSSLSITQHFRSSISFSAWKKKSLIALCAFLSSINLSQQLIKMLSTQFLVFKVESFRLFKWGYSAIRWSGLGFLHPLSSIYGYLFCVKCPGCWFMVEPRNKLH